ncbi:MAG: SurA N-terminal domain-containing protein [Synergistaceae bacterium]|jgi:hypothetical protein|nr:SurA N-terminal domain-containing protein [Synergistaceae bacterium]
MMQYLRKSIKPIMLFIVIIFVVSCFFMYGGATGSGSSAASLAANVSGDVLLKDYDVAVVDGERITYSRLEIEVAQFIKAMGLETSAASTDYPEFRNTVLDRIATLKELDKEIVSRKIVLTKEEIDAAINEIEAQFPTREIFLQQIQQAGLTEAQLKQDVEENMKRTKVLDEVTAAISTDEAELRNFYDMMKTYAFQKPEGFTMDVAHFGTTEAAEAARGELVAGKKWEDVIAAASSDVTDYSTPDNRMFIPTEQLVEDVAFLKEQAIGVPSKVVSFTSDDHMIVVKRTKEEAGTAEFDEVSADIEQMLVSQKKNSSQSQFMQELRARANVEILDQELFRKPEPEVSADIAISGDAAVSSEVVVSGDVAADVAASGDVSSAQTLPPSPVETSSSDETPVPPVTSEEEKP